ncbi:hypothetical protein EVAR_27539_1 [Eumeta japonica]|uniref:Uncharacterized protein n=1 Tax=Eumeta variegata TaxID=151549 RepID=A0A4C1W449_EUMVA|nr:hypothetical protein EVAR_27539_1 [Eumeta japonica]
MSRCVRTEDTGDQNRKKVSGKESSGNVAKAHMNKLYRYKQLAVKLILYLQNQVMITDWAWQHSATSHTVDLRPDKRVNLSLPVRGAEDRRWL